MGCLAILLASFGLVLLLILGAVGPAAVFIAVSLVLAVFSLGRKDHV